LNPSSPAFQNRPIPAIASNAAIIAETPDKYSPVAKNGRPSLGSRKETNAIVEAVQKVTRDIDRLAWDGIMHAQYGA
jgi:hypothetical protein